MKNENNPHETPRSIFFLPTYFGLALLGTGIGLIFGAILDNLPIGALIGCIVGFIIGLFQDWHSKKQNKV
jgi:F0F1-type ATP synthase assembly protein I